MRLHGRPRGILFIAVVLGSLAGCSNEDPFDTRVKNIPGRFKVGRHGYLLSQKEPGVIEDQAVVYTADAGARTFDFKSRTVLRHLFVGKWDNFDALPPEERKEVRVIANGGLEFLAWLEKKQRHLSDLDKQHRDMLKAFLVVPAGVPLGEIGREVVVRVLKVYDAPSAWSGIIASTQRIDVVVTSTSSQSVSPGQNLQIGVYAFKGSSLFDGEVPRLSPKRVSPDKLLTLRVAPGCIWGEHPNEVTIEPDCVEAPH